MWLVKNTTPYAAAGTWVQDKDANKIWLVVVKATFDIQPKGPCRLAEEQAPVLRMCEPVGELGTSSLAYECDLFGLKPTTDILVNGSAWAPAGRLADVVDVRVAVGPVEKRLRVFGERIWERSVVGSLVASGPQHFESMPIVYERAFGGWDRSSSNPADHRLESRNPVGCGFAVSPDNSAGQRLPNVEYPDELINSWDDRPRPAGFNVVDSAWSPRRELAGTYDEAWRKNRLPLWAEDFDPRYNNCAPEDQQAQGFLRGGEAVDLANLSPTGRLTFELPRIYPFFETRFGSEAIQHRAQLSAVIIEPDKPRVMMAWQTSLVCNHRVDDLDMTVVTEKRVI